MEEFYSRIHQLPADVYSLIDDQIARYHVHSKDVTELLLVGFDADGSHIYTIFDPGRSECFDSIGFNAVGSGEPHAVSTITSYDYTSDFSLDEAVWIAYEAKKKAEKAPGVGRDIDMCIVGADHDVCYIEDKFISKLAKKFKEKFDSDKQFLETIPKFTIKNKDDE